eukprot:117963_1
MFMIKTMKLYQYKRCHLLIHEWKIYDTETVQKIKSNSIFEAFGVKWYVGCVLEGNGSIFDYIFVKAVYLSPKMVYRIKVLLTWVESGKTETFTESYSAKHTCYGMGNWCSTSTDIGYYDNLNTFTFKVKLKLIDVYENDELVTDDVKQQEITIYDSLPKYTWKIPQKTLAKMKASSNK